MSATRNRIKKPELISKTRGLGAIEQVKRKGFDVVAYEARDSVGGLWSVGPECRALGMPHADVVAQEL